MPLSISPRKITPEEFLALVSAVLKHWVRWKITEWSSDNWLWTKAQLNNRVIPIEERNDGTRYVSVEWEQPNVKGKAVFEFVKREHPEGDVLEAELVAARLTISDWPTTWDRLRRLILKLF